VPTDPGDGVSQWAGFVNDKASAARVPPCALAAIVSRETGGANVFQTGVPPGPGCGVGLCQITFGVQWADVANPTFVLDDIVYDLMDPASNLAIAARAFLFPAIVHCEVLRVLCPKTFARFSQEILFFAYCCYNSGFDTLRNAIYLGENPDLHTTNFYAKDTLRRYHGYIASSHAARKVADVGTSKSPVA
jgi:hypothetical protein